MRRPSRARVLISDRTELVLAQHGAIFVDHTHCGRHVTGLERITLELFSAQALAPLEITPVTAKTRAGMMARQMLQLPLQALAAPGSLLLCPGFPPAHLATLLGARVLPYIHDLFLITRAQDLNFRARLAMRAPFRFAVARLPRFMVNSQTTAQELRRFCRPDAEILLYRPRVRNVFGLASAAGHEGRGLKLIALGTVEPRKNLFAAAAVVMALRARGIVATLDVVGRPGWGVDLAALAAMPGVTLHGYQPLERVRELIQHSEALISTAHDEGLGLPLLEAQYAGIAVIAPDKPVFREVLGASGLLVDAGNADAAAAAIAAMVAPPGWRAAAAARARANLALWNSQAAQDRDGVIGAIARLASRRGAPVTAGPAC